MRQGGSPCEGSASSMAASVKQTKARRPQASLEIALQDLFWSVAHIVMHEFPENMKSAAG